jgi:hypothetical protein
MSASRRRHRGPVEPVALPGHMGIMSTKPNPQTGSKPPASPSPATADQHPSSPGASGPAPKEIGGPKGPEPTRYGDWEVNGRCSDF